MQLSKMTAFIVASIIGSGLSTPVMDFELLDDMIYSVKCAAAEDVAACKTKAKQEYDDYAQRKLGASGNTTNGSAPIDNSYNINYRERCEEARVVGPTSVDAAYNRAMNKFRLTSPEELA